MQGLQNKHLVIPNDKTYLISGNVLYVFVPKKYVLSLRIFYLYILFVICNESA